MPATVFEYLISCKCSQPVLIQDPDPHIPTVATEAGKQVGLVIRQRTREGRDSASWLDRFPFTVSTNADPPLPHGGGPAKTVSVSRHILTFEDCATPASRRMTAQQWGLCGLSFEQHFQDIAGWSGCGVGECPCRCHHHPGGESDADECLSVDTTLALVAAQSGTGEEGRERLVDPPEGWPSEGRKRFRSEETNLYIDSWREQCREEQCRTAEPQRRRTKN